MSLKAFKKRPFSRKVRVAIKHHPDLWEMYCSDKQDVHITAERNFIALLLPLGKSNWWHRGSLVSEQPYLQIKDRLWEYSQLSPLELLAECGK